MIHSGEMHYARVPKEYWRHRLKMMRAMGLNTVCTYVFWNYHHPTPSSWDFKNDNHNLREFIKTAEDEGLMVILRPGPYACAEWEFGGYPWWLQQNKDLVIRANNKAFLDSCQTYINHLAAEVKDLQASKGGPVILIQVENEFGSYVDQRKDIKIADHKAYNKAIFQQLKDAGLEGPFFTSDGSWLFEGGSIPGVLPTANGEGNVTNLKSAVNKYNNNEGPYMVAEYYPGWLDHWGEEFVKVSTESVVNQLKTYLDSGIHFNIYMAHGGTNFGFWAGANYNKEHQIQPDITSYDYDAPISEPGWATPKFMAIRELMQKYSNEKLPEIPEQIPVLPAQAFNITASADFYLSGNLGGSPGTTRGSSFEDLDQGKGFILYETILGAQKDTLHIPGLRDYGLVYSDGRFIGELNRQKNKFKLPIQIHSHTAHDGPPAEHVGILVENMGRINYGGDIVNNQKGILGTSYLGKHEIDAKSWRIFNIPMDSVPKVERNSVKPSTNSPALYRYNFDLTETGDMFLDMASWGKGIVFVNGRNIGRYWNIGPQQTLYVPGCWLNKGENQIVVFEMLNELENPVLESVTQPVLDKLNLKD